MRMPPAPISAAPNFARANLAGTSFRKADLYDAHLDEAMFRDTTMPDGTTQP